MQVKAGRGPAADSECLMEPALEYHAPESLERAVAMLAEEPGAGALLGGGTDLVAALKCGLLRVRRLVSLRAVPAHREIARTADGGLRIGAFATLHAVAGAAAVRAACPALAEAAAQTASPALRNRATLGGNACIDTRCWYYNQSARWRAHRAPCLKAGGERCYANQGENRCVALFSADTPAALVACGARVTLRGPRGERTQPLENLYSGDGLTPLVKDPAEIVTGIELPAAPAGSGSAYEKWRERDSIEFPVVGAAAYLRLGPGGEVAEARIVLTGVGPGPLRLGGTEAALAGRAAPDEADREIADAVSRSLGVLYLAEAVPHKRRVAGVCVAAAVARAAAAARAARSAA